MRLLKIASCFLVVFFASCKSDNLVYYIDGKIVASEHQKTTNQKSFSFDLTTSEDFKVYVKELSELTTLNLKIKSTVDLESDNNIIKINGNQFSFKDIAIFNNSSIEIFDANILNLISNQLLKNKRLDLILESDALNSENQFSIEMSMDLKGTFLGVH